MTILTPKVSPFSLVMSSSLFYEYEWDSGTGREARLLFLKEHMQLPGVVHEKSTIEDWDSVGLSPPGLESVRVSHPKG